MTTWTNGYFSIIRVAQKKDFCWQQATRHEDSAKLNMMTIKQDTKNFIHIKMIQTIIKKNPNSHDLYF